MRTTEFAPAFEASPAPTSEPAPTTVIYGPPQWAQKSFTGGFPGSAFTLQPDGSLLCPTNHPLYPQERRPERNGSYRLLYAARIGDCRRCELRTQCQESPSTSKPRRVSAVIFPLSAHQALAPAPPIASPEPLPQPIPVLPHAPVLWEDWPRCQIRRHWLNVLRSETVVVMKASPTEEPTLVTSEPVMTRTQRAHWRLSWNERLTRNARPPTLPALTITIHGLPATFAHSFGFGLLPAA